MKAAQLALQRAKSLSAFTRQPAVASAEQTVRKCRAEERAASWAVSLFDAPYEEINIAYVAITRAKKVQLTLAGAG